MGKKKKIKFPNKLWFLAKNYPKMKKKNGPQKKTGNQKEKKKNCKPIQKCIKNSPPQSFAPFPHSGPKEMEKNFLK